MRFTIIHLGFFGLLAGLSCSKNQRSDATTGTTTVTGATVDRAPTAEEIRLVLMQSEPNQPAVAAFDITDDGGHVTVRGVAPDQKTHDDVVNRIKSMPNVRDVRDEVSVASPSATTQAVRVTMKRDEPAAAAVIDHLVISDDGTAVLIEGIVPDDATHDALLDSAKKASNGKNVTDKLRVSGK